MKLIEVLQSLESGSRPKGGLKEIEEGVPSIGGEHLDKNGYIILDKMGFVLREFYNNLRRGRIQKGDVLIVKDGATTGKVALIRKDFPYSDASVNEHVFICRSRRNFVLPEYLFYHLFSINGQNQIKKSFHGSAIGGITANFADDYKITIPPLETQRRIVAILDKAEETRRLRAQVDELASKLPMNIFLDMFGDPKYNIKGWEMVTPPDIASKDRNAITIGPFGSDLMAKDYREKGVPLVFVKNIRENKFDGEEIRHVDYSKAEELKSHRVTPGDILMTKMGDPPGDVAIYPENMVPGIITADCIKFTVDHRYAANIYVLYALDTDYVRNQVIKNTKGAAQQKINLNIFKTIKFPLPPIELQNDFSKMVDRSEKIRALQRESYSGTEYLLATLMQKAFTGELIS